MRHAPHIDALGRKLFSDDPSHRAGAPDNECFHYESLLFPSLEKVSHRMSGVSTCRTDPGCQKAIYHRDTETPEETFESKIFFLDLKQKYLILL
jgi:hypothetical protein